MGAVAGWAASCGSGSVQGSLDPTGGEVCLPDRRVCIEVPRGGLAEAVVVRIAPSDERPPWTLSEAFDISAQNRPDLEFVKPAKVSFRIELLPDGGTSVSENLLRVYTITDGEWVACDNPYIDRVRGAVVGETMHLSPFVVMRADRLPDGGIPVEGDAGPPRDSGVIVIPPCPTCDAGVDAGRPDAGTPDAGRPDAGPPDAGRPDAGPPDAGPPDAGPPDAGPPDAGPPDAGPPDAGPPDAGPPDAGPPDAGPPDAGPPDAGPPDAGPPDAGDPDAGADGG